MNKNNLLLLTATLITISTSAIAGTKVYSPNVEQGELELEYRGNYDFDKRANKDHGQKHKYAIGYGFTDYYASEIYLIAKNPAGQGAANKGYETESIEWENRFQLTEQGKNFADVGFYLAFEKALESKEEHDVLEVKLLLEKQIGKYISRANLTAEREFRQVNGSKAARGFGTGIDFMTKYTWKKSFEPGFEYHVNFGNHTDGTTYSEQEHQVGPNIYGKIGAFKYDLGLLFGVSKAATDRQIKWNLEYEF